MAHHPLARAALLAFVATPLPLAAGCSCARPEGDPDAPVPGFDICPGEQLKMMNAKLPEECCAFCQHTDGTIPVGEHWVMNRNVDPNTNSNWRVAPTPPRLGLTTRATNPLSPLGLPGG